ncbi:MAG: hypothetical protein J2P17_07625 [Mycobacterium sp.]|nr:hypothetical protein [Mycobacterium sp.]
MFELRQLKLDPEIQCFPIWVHRDGILDNVSPDSLAISRDLAEDLLAWGRRWDATYDLVNNPGNPRFHSATDERIFWEDGRQLADRLKEELGRGWIVEFKLES